jgi:hypothetical protein
MLLTGNDRKGERSRFRHERHERHERHDRHDRHERL